MKTLITTFSLIFLAFFVNAQERISTSDFQPLDNTSWKGQLTYKDYQSGQPTTIDATMQIYVEDNKIMTNVQYTYEPNKNNKSSVKIKKNGQYYGNEKVIQNTLENNTRTIVTTYKGRDANKKATIYKTYLFNDTSFTVTKEVVFKGTTERFTRNQYTFNKL